MQLILWWGEHKIEMEPNVIDWYVKFEIWPKALHAKWFTVALTLQWGMDVVTWRPNAIDWHVKFEIRSRALQAKWHTIVLIWHEVYIFYWYTWCYGLMH